MRPAAPKISIEPRSSSRRRRSLPPDATHGALSLSHLLLRHVVADGNAAKLERHHTGAGDFDFGNDVEQVSAHVGERIVAGFQGLVGPGMLVATELAQLGDGLGKQAHPVWRDRQGEFGEFTRNRYLLID